MNSLGKYVAEEWRSLESTFKCTWLRRLNRETKKYYVSDCQWLLIADGSQTYNYRRAYRMATRFLKTNESFIKRSVSKRYNSDGTFKISLLNDFSELSYCDHSFEDIIEKDLREINSESLEVQKCKI